MLKIRLQKVGKKNAPSYRIVLAEHTSKPQGKFIEILGFYNPRLKQKGFKKERIEHWIAKGAKPSPTVHNLLIDEKIIQGEKLRAWKAKKRAKAKPVEVPKTEVSTEETKESESEKPETEKPVEETPKKEVKESETEELVEEAKPKEEEKKEEELDKNEKID